MKNTNKTQHLSIELDKLIIEQKRKVYFIPLDTIMYIERELRQSFIVTEDGQTYQTYQSLKAIEALLPRELFFRTHKSCIVNIQQIQEIEHFSNTTYIVKFHSSNHTAYITRDRLKQLLTILSTTVLTNASGN